jgi:voltage-gated sodium channel
MSETVVGVPQVSRLERFVEHEWFRGTIIALIAINAVLLGVETARDLPVGLQDLILRINQMILSVFVIELILRIAVYRLAFFREAWSVFDFVIVAAALIVPGGPFQVVRTLRILRALRLISTVPSLRRVVDGLLGAVPGIASVLFLLLLVLYVAGVMATVLFRDVAPENFGNLGISLFSLFQIMTLEGWAEIAARVMEHYKWAWVFFIGYILVATFLVLNLVIGVVVSSIQSRIERETAEQAADDSALKDELIALRQEINSLRESLDRRQ